MPSLRGRSAALRKQSDTFFAFLWRNKRITTVVVVLALLIILFSEIIIPAAVIITLGIIASFSTSYKRFLRIPPAVELITFTTVIVALAYGPLIGAIYGAVVSFIAEILTNALDFFVITFVPSRAIMALVAGFFFNQFSGNILITGFVCSVFYNLIAQPLYIFMADVEMRMKSFFFLFFNIGSNFVIFAVLGKIMVKLLGIA